MKNIWSIEESLQPAVEKRAEQVDTYWLSEPVRTGFLISTICMSKGDDVMESG